MRFPAVQGAAPRPVATTTCLSPAHHASNGREGGRGRRPGKGTVGTCRSPQSVDASQNSLFPKHEGAAGGAGSLEDTTTSHVSLRPSRLGLGVLVVLTGVVTVASLG